MNFETRLLALCWILWTAGTVSTGAQTAGNRTGTDSGNDPVVGLGEMIVTAPGEDRDLLATPTVESLSLDIATSSIDAETIRLLDANTLTEALDLAPSVFTETRGRKEKQFSSFRGQIYPYPDYALNGVWQRAFWEIPAFFPAAAVDHIEVLRSGGAIMVGPNSGLVGAINVVPRRFDELTTILDAQGGSYGTFRSSIVRGDRFDSGDYTVGVGYYRTDGPDGENAAEEFSSLFGTVGWDASDSVQLELTAFGLTGDRELRKIRDPGLKKFQNQTEQFSPHNSYGSILRTLFKHGDDSSTEIDVGYAGREERYRSEQTGKATTVHDDDDSEYNAGVLHARRLSDVNTLRAGFQYNRWTSPDGKRFFVGTRMDVDTLSGVLMDEHQTDRWTIDGGLRVTRSYYRDYTDTSFNIVGNKLASRPIEDEWGDTALTGTLGGKYDMGQDMALYTHGAVGSVEAPPGAVSETSDSLDRETREVIDCGFALGAPDKGILSAGLFLTLRQNAILLTATKVTEDDDIFNSYANNDVRQYGIELEGRSAPLLGTVRLFGSATIMDSEKSVDGDWETYREIPNAVVTAGLNAAAGRFDMNLFAKHVSKFKNKRFAQDGQYKDLGDFVDINLTGGVSLGSNKSTRLYVSLENLLDDKYSTVVGFPDYGFQAFAGVEHRF